MHPSRTTWLLPQIPSIAVKATMALTGMALATWLTLHMLGNLTIFGGPTLMNGYALKLRETGLLWPMRIGLTALLAVHAVSAVVVTARSRRARPVSYHRLKPQTSTVSSRSMRWGGVFLLVYLGYHVPHMYGVGHASFVRGDVYHNLVAALESPLHMALNLGAVVVLSLHLAHGLTSAFRSLGWVAPGQERRMQVCMRAWVVAVTAGFALPPASVWLGLVR